MNASDAAFELAASSAEADFPLMLAPPETEDVLDLTVPAPVETAVEAEPLTVAPVLAADIAAGGAERVPKTQAPDDESAPTARLPEPAPEDAEAHPMPAPFVQSEPAARLTPAMLHTPERAPPVGPQATPAPTPLQTPRFTELADYWRSLRQGDDHPAAESIDRDLVTERWPGSLLVAYTPASQDPRGEPRPGRVTWLGTACAATQSAVDAGSHSTEWMLEVAHTALVNDEPLEEQQRLATLTGDAGFRMVALPLGPPKGLANAVLCTLLPSPGAPRFGKRRTWL